jgi:hypothetical protein
MARASTHQSADFVKILYVGTSGTGKTGSLVSLVEAGYNLRILDMDNGLDALIMYIKHRCPERIDQVDFITLRDKMKADPLKAAIVSGSPKAYTDAIKYMTRWDDNTIPAEWGPDTIFVLDSLTLFGRAAKNWAEGMNPGSKDPRQWFYAAQESMIRVVDMLTSEAFRTNVIVITHVDLVEQPDGTLKGFASALGKAMGSKLPTVFNTMVLAESKGSGDNIRRTITTAPTSIIDLKNPKPYDIPKSLPLDTGMATIFEKLKGAHK